MQCSLQCPNATKINEFCHCVAQLNAQGNLVQAYPNINGLLPAPQAMYPQTMNENLLNRNTIRIIVQPVSMQSNYMKESLVPKG